jgi:hypothetical protein
MAKGEKGNVKAEKTHGPLNFSNEETVDKSSLFHDEES